MEPPRDTDDSRAQTDHSLTAERERSDDELLARSTALAEDAEDIIRSARERAREVLALARGREDKQLSATGASTEVRSGVRDERNVADAALAAEHATADAARLDERERRRLAVIQLLAHEREATDRTLAAERSIADRNLDAREDLLTLVAHDLRGMLNTILINASTIVMSTDATKVVNPAANIQRVTAQMAQLLEDIVDFSSFEAGQLRLRMADVDVVQLVRDAAAIHQAVADKRGIALDVTPSQDSVTLRADGRRLTRLFLNLISNALKFTRSGGHVEVSVTIVDNECEVAVRDDGIGIPEDQLQTIFERFRQAGAEPRRSFGAGLGLYISRMIARAHGGRVWAESASDAGATLRVRLPMASEPRER